MGENPEILALLKAKAIPLGESVVGERCRMDIGGGGKCVLVTLGDDVYEVAATVRPDGQGVGVCKVDAEHYMMDYYNQDAMVHLPAKVQHAMEVRRKASSEEYMRRQRRHYEYLKARFEPEFAKTYERDITSAIELDKQFRLALPNLSDMMETTNADIEPNE
jgi:hypothetical protein